MSKSNSRCSHDIDPSTARVACEIFQVKHNHGLPNAPAVPLKFVPLPGLYFLFLAVAMLAYFLLVEVVKRRLMGRCLGEAASND